MNVYAELCNQAVNAGDCGECGKRAGHEDPCYESPNNCSLGPVYAVGTGDGTFTWHCPHCGDSIESNTCPLPYKTVSTHCYRCSRHCN